MNEYRWDDLHVGLRAEFSATFTQQQAESFASLAGDRNPLHLDHAYAVSAGFAGPVLFGMLTSSLYSCLVGEYLPGRLGLLHGIDIDFKAPSYAGERLHVYGEVAFLQQAYHRFEIKAGIRKDDGQVVSKATIRVGFQRV